MARRTTVRTTGLDELARRLDRFSSSLVREVNIEMMGLANAAIEKMASPFARAIEGGPVAFTKIRPGSKTSSVLRGRPEKGSDGVETHQIRVNRLQSGYLRHHLEDDSGRIAPIRRPGEVGVAERRNFIPDEKNLASEGHGGVTAEGNLHRRKLKTLFSRAQTLKQRNEAQRERDRRRLARLLNRDADDQELDAFREEKKRKRVRRRAGSKSDIFYGVPRGRKRSRLGFWQRPAHKKGRLKPLVHAEEKSDYKPNTKLQGAWNVGVEMGTSDADRRLERAVERALARSRGA